VRLSNALQQGIFMSEVHIEEHSSPIKTPKQLIIVVLLSFLVPIVLIVMLSQLITTGVTPGKDSQGGASDEVIAARIKPIGQVEVTDPNAPKVEKTGKEIVDAVCSACHATGALNAPKIGDKAAWAPRVKQGKDALYKVSLQGKPGTAMVAKGGFANLADADVKAVVDLMMAKAK